MSKKQSKIVPSKSHQRPRWLLPAVIGGALVAMVSLILIALANRQPAYTAEVKGESRAQIDQTEIGHGDVRFETPVESVFRVRNVGDQSLQILGEPWVEVVEGC